MLYLASYRHTPQLPQGNNSGLGVSPQLRHRLSQKWKSKTEHETTAVSILCWRSSTELTCRKQTWKSWYWMLRTRAINSLCLDFESAIAIPWHCAKSAKSAKVQNGKISGIFSLLMLSLKIVAWHYHYHYVYVRTLYAHKNAWQTLQEVHCPPCLQLCRQTLTFPTTSRVCSLSA